MGQVIDRNVLVKTINIIFHKSCQLSWEGIPQSGIWRSNVDREMVVTWLGESSQRCFQFTGNFLFELVSHRVFLFPSPNKSPDGLHFFVCICICVCMNI